jgi:polyisoprenyl-teichoic acid--peptidoglycan teichoic acid transferase
LRYNGTVAERRQEKLYVPPPPPRGDWRERVKVEHEDAPRRRLGGCGPALLALLILVVGTVAACLCFVLVDAPRFFLPGDGGRANVLLLGVDRRSGDDWTYRTDTMMVATLDPASHTAGLLSIPRDLQVPIPGYGEDRINTANVYGYLRDVPGGGPALARSTVETNFGISIDGYVMLDFYAFERIVDDLGGIDVYVSETLHDTQYPDPRPGDPHAYTTIHFDPGWQRMDGRRALQYARSRMSTSDFDRARRQQEIVLAIRKRALSLEAVPRWPVIVASVLDSVKTDMGPAELAALAYLGARVNPEQMERLVLEQPYVYGYRRADGAAVQLPNWELIRPVVAQLFD